MSNAFIFTKPGTPNENNPTDAIVRAIGEALSQYSSTPSEGPPAGRCILDMELSFARELGDWILDQEPTNKAFQTAAWQMSYADRKSHPKKKDEHCERCGEHHDDDVCDLDVGYI